jgi:hypothetical protein
MDHSELHDFVTKTAARGRITFGDLRRLQRQYLPRGVSTFEEAELVIRLDAMARRADKAWTEWLIAAIRDFSVSSGPAIGPDGSSKCEWVTKLLGAIGAPTRAARRIARQIQLASEPIDPPIEQSVQRYNWTAQPVPCGAVDRYMTGLELAA